MPIPLQQLYEEFNRRGHDTHEYNRLLSSVLAELANNQQAQTIVWDNGVPYIFDPLRNKYLSLTRTVVTGAIYGGSINSTYLRIDGVATMANQGFLIPRNATITALWAKSRPTSWNIEVRKNGIPITLVGVPVLAGSGSDGTIDLDLSQGEWIQLYANGSSIAHPIAAVELAWRLDV